MSEEEQANIEKYKFDNQNADVEVISDIDVSVNLEVIMQLYGFGILIVLVSSIIPTMLVFRYKPKKILSSI